MLHATNRIVHAKYNKIDGIMHLKLLSEQGKLPDLAVEKFAIQSISEIPSLVLDKNRDCTLLVRSSFQAGRDTEYLEWLRQPRKKFGVMSGSNRNAAERRINRDLEDFMLWFRLHPAKACEMQALVHHLADEKYAFLGESGISSGKTLDEISYFIRLTPEKSSTKTEKTFRDSDNIVYLEEYDAVKGLRIYEHMAKGSMLRPKVIGAAEKIRSVMGIFTDALGNGRAELNFVLYQGSDTPYFYDFLKTC